MSPEEIRGRLAALGAPRQSVSAGQVKVMLAEMRDEPFSGAGWLFELKHDGFRLLAAREHSRARLAYRRGNDSTHAFPELARALEALPCGDLILDGEVVVLDESGHSSFQGLQKRVQLLRRPDIERAAQQWPATLFAFDLLAFEGYDLRPLPLRARKELLRQVLPADGPLRYADHVEEQGQALFAEVRRRGLEGMVAKRADSPYVAGRSAQWLKVRTEKSSDFVVVGFTKPDGPGRPGFGSLHLGAYEGGELIYCGRAGSGFSERQLNDIRRTLDADVRHGAPCTGPRPQGRGHVWVKPRLICEVRFKQWTEEGLLRQPVFVRLRDDKDLQECLREGPPLEVAPPVAAARPIHFTTPDTVFWPEDGYTKGDLIEFYREASPWLLPYLKERPLVLTRYPDGIHGDSQREAEHVVCDDVETLVSLANLGTIPLHVWSSRISRIQQPDWCLLDLDPQGAPFEHVVEVARALKALADDIGLPAYAKTSGSTGLHVLVPLGAQCTYEESRSLAQLMAWVITRERGDKVYVDYQQNVQGQLLASPFSVGALPGAPVSMPLTWSEVTKKLDPSRFTLRTVVARMEKRGADPMAGLLSEKPDLLKALGRLQERLEASADGGPGKRGGRG